MVEKKHSLGKSARAIKVSLAALLGNGNVERIDVAANEWGRLDVVIGTDLYRGVGPVERVDRVLKHLEKSLDPADLANVGKVWVLDVEEYENVVGFSDSIEKLLKDDQFDGGSNG